jgi:small subunit ribosomal protein S18
MEKNLDYKDAFTLKKYVTRKGKLLPRAKTGLSAHEQRKLSREVKKARYMAIMPYSTRD